jgi:hypothetical protein
MSIEIVRGQKYTQTIGLQDDAGNPWNLTGKNVVIKYPVSFTSGASAYKVTSIVGDALLGNVSLSLDDVDTFELTAGDMPVDIYVGTIATTSPQGVVLGTDIVDNIFKISEVFTVVDPNN